MTVAERIEKIRREMDVLVDMELIRRCVEGEHGKLRAPLEAELRSNIEDAERVRDAILADPRLEAACAARGEMPSEKMPGEPWGRAVVEESLTACLDSGLQHRRRSMLDTLVSGEREREEARLGLDPGFWRALEAARARYGEDEAMISLAGDDLADRVRRGGGLPAVFDAYESAARARYEDLVREESMLAANLHERHGWKWTHEVLCATGLLHAEYAARALAGVRRERQDLDALRAAQRLLADAGRSEESREVGEAARDLEASLDADRTEGAALTEAEVLIARAESSVGLRHGRELADRLNALRRKLEDDAQGRPSIGDDWRPEDEDDPDDVPFDPTEEDLLLGDGRDDDDAEDEGDWRGR